MSSGKRKVKRTDSPKAVADPKIRAAVEKARVARTAANPMTVEQEGIHFKLAMKAIYEEAAVETVLVPSAYRQKVLDAIDKP